MDGKSGKGFHSSAGVDIVDANCERTAASIQRLEMSLQSAAAGRRIGVAEMPEESDTLGLKKSRRERFADHTPQLILVSSMFISA